MKKIFFSDVTTHNYSVQVHALSGKWEKNITHLYTAGMPLGGKKKLSFTSEEDFAVRLFEDGVLVAEYTVTGIASLLEGAWKEYNMTGPPKVSAQIPLETSGIIDMKTPTATVEELYWVNVTKPKIKNVSETNSSNDTENVTSEDADTSTESSQTDADLPETAPNDASNETTDSNISNASVPKLEDLIEYVTELKQKKKKHEKKLSIQRTDFKPMPLTDARIEELIKKFADMAKAEEDVMAVNQLKNDLEASIYGSREKMDMDSIIKVSTEQQREEVSKLCAEYEEWMWESGATRSDYESRLQKLRDLLASMDERAMELEAREDLPEKVSEVVDEVTKGVAFIAKNMTWVNETKTEAVSAKLSEFREWWSAQVEKQKSLPLHEAPAFTKSDVMQRLSKIQSDLGKLLKTKKPKEQKPKTEKDKKTKGKGKTEDEPLPDTLEEAEKMLASVQTEKSAAVEAEDFDRAHALKQREKSLSDHIAKLQAAKTEL